MKSIKTFSLCVCPIIAGFIFFSAMSPLLRASPGVSIGDSLDADQRAPKAQPDPAIQVDAPLPAPDNAAPQEQRRESSIPADMVIQPVENLLSPDAQEICAYLLFIQSILNEDEPGLLEAAALLEPLSAPPSVWLDGGVWLMSRKSPNSVIYLEDALKSAPENLSLNLLYAEALGEHGMAAQGVERMRKYLETHPDELDAQIEMALLMVKNKEFTEAQRILNSIKPAQRSYLVDFYQGQALLGMDRRSEAIPYLAKAVKAMPDFMEALVDLAFAYEQEGNYREARNTYDKLLKMNYMPGEVGLRLINLSLKLKQPDRALRYLKQGPDTIPFRLAAVNLLIDSRHFLQAENVLKQLASGENPPPEVFLLLAEVVYEQRHSLKMAFSWLDKIPQGSPQASRAMFLRVQLLSDAGQAEQALTETDKAISDFPDAPEFTDFKIRLLARDKKLGEALELARAAAKKWPDNPGILFLLGSLLDENGEKKEAMTIMEKILAGQPDNYQALNYVGFTLADENRDLDRALELLKKANELSPNQSYIIDSLAWALHRAGKGKDALTQIRRAINLGDAADAAIWEHYGDIAASQGKKDEARRAYRRAIQLKPANADDIRKRLSTL